MTYQKHHKRFLLQVFWFLTQKGLLPDYFMIKV